MFSLESSLLQAEQPPLFQPFLTAEVFQPSDYYCALTVEKTNGILGKHCQQVKEGDPSPMLSTGEINLEFLVQCWVPQYKSDLNILK